MAPPRDLPLGRSPAVEEAVAGDAVTRPAEDGEDECVLLCVCVCENVYL